jgi:hypothetical protein
MLKKKKKEEKLVNNKPQRNPSLSIHLLRIPPHPLIHGVGYAAVLDGPIGLRDGGQLQAAARSLELGDHLRVRQRREWGQEREEKKSREE